LAGEADFAAEALEQARIVRSGRRQELQRDDLIELQVEGTIDLAL